MEKVGKGELIFVLCRRFWIGMKKKMRGKSRGFGREKKDQGKNNLLAAVTLSLTMILLTGCAVPFSEEKEEGEPLSFTVISKEVTPKEVLAEMEKRGTEPFQFTFRDGEEMYVCVGYGAQKGQGYSICVDECTKKEDVLYINMTLLGPEAGKGSERGISYPYIVIRTEYTELPVLVE